MCNIFRDYHLIYLNIHLLSILFDYCWIFRHNSCRSQCIHLFRCFSILISVASMNYLLISLAQYEWNVNTFNLSIYSHILSTNNIERLTDKASTLLQLTLWIMDFVTVLFIWYIYIVWWYYWCILFIIVLFNFRLFFVIVCFWNEFILLRRRILMGPNGRCRLRKLINSEFFLHFAIFFSHKLSKNLLNVSVWNFNYILNYVLLFIIC